MTDELMEQRMAELNAHNAEKGPIPDNEKRAYSVDDIMAILDISRSSAYILIKKNLFRSVKFVFSKDDKTRPLGVLTFFKQALDIFSARVW